MNEFLAYLVQHPEVLWMAFQALLLVVGILIALGVITNKKVVNAYTFAVAATEQMKKVKRTKEGITIDGEAAQAYALKLIEKKLGKKHKVDVEMLEGLVNLITKPEGKGVPDVILDVLTDGVGEQAGPLRDALGRFVKKDAGEME